MLWRLIVFHLAIQVLLVASLPVDLVKRPARYLIQMKKPMAIESLCLNDDKLKTTNHVRSGIHQIISIGKFEGVVGEFTKDVLERLNDNPMIESIVPDEMVHAVDVQDDAPHHLVRLSQYGPVNEDDTEYYYNDTMLGKGTIAYVLDTGVLVDHPEFEGRAVLGPNFSDDVKHVDYVGHGTHVAGIIGSRMFGVAKKCNIVSIKTLDRSGQGSLSSVITGLEYAVNHHEEAGVPGVVNLSLGAAKNTVLDSAVNAAVDAGLTVVVASGNSNTDACRTSPGGASGSITVGAIDDTNDRVASFSNWGRCVDLFAGGVSVQSLSNNPFDYSAVRMMSGTSMACPVVAGVVTTLLGSGVPMKDIRGRLSQLAVKDAIARTDLMLRPGSPNMIANTGFKEVVESNMTNYTLI